MGGEIKMFLFCLEWWWCGRVKLDIFQIFETPSRKDSPSPAQQEPRCLAPKLAFQNWDGAALSTSKITYVPRGNRGGLEPAQAGGENPVPSFCELDRAHPKANEKGRRRMEERKRKERRKDERKIRNDHVGGKGKRAQA